MTSLPATFTCALEYFISLGDSSNQSCKVSVHHSEATHYTAPIKSVVETSTIQRSLTTLRGFQTFGKNSGDFKELAYLENRSIDHITRHNYWLYC